MSTQTVAAGLDRIAGDLSGFIEKSRTQTSEIQNRILGLEQFVTRPNGSGAWGGDNAKTLGELVVDSPQVKSFLENRFSQSGKVMVGDLFGKKTAIVTSNDLFAQAQRVPNITAVTQPLRVRDLLRITPATSNLVQFVREVPGTTVNAAAPQGLGSSPQVYENVAKPESAIGFELVNQPIQTIAHWIPASKQVVADSDALRNFLNSRMIYMLHLVEENELLNGTNAGGHLNGLMASATAYNAADNVAGDTKLDQLRRAINQVQVSGFSPNAVVLHPNDWTGTQLIKTTGSASSGEYVFANPSVVGQPQVWGVPVVLSVKQAAGKFLVADLQNGAELFDRMEATISVSLEHSDFFTKNMAAILAELREALVVYQPDSMRAGTFA